MTATTPYVARLSIYPVKSLDGVRVETVSVLKSGALKGDRQFAIFDSSGQFVNGKRNQRIHTIRSEFDLERHQILLRIQGCDQAHAFNLKTDQRTLERWLSDYLEIPVTIQQNLETGFPDDTESPGPTIISTATLGAIASWYPDLTIEEVRERFRSNIEIAGVPAFWEDRLYATAGDTVQFQIGDVQLRGINPCQRCVVITRNPQTGEAYPQFQKTFVTQRRNTLPDWAERSRFNHFYRLAVNTRLPVSEAGKTICIGDQVALEIR